MQTSHKARIKDMAPPELKERANAILKGLDREQESHEQTHSLSEEYFSICKECYEHSGESL